jgi:drug/metabolite transporter (DMT)-like permease
LTAFALTLVLLSAVAHASWNLIAKRASGGPAFNWLFDCLSVVLCLPLATAQMVLQPTSIGPIEVMFVVGSGVLHTVYFLLLGQGYKRGDLSLVYPLARGVGPMLATIGAVLLLGEHPSGLALAGALLIGVGVFVLAGDPRRLVASRAGASVTFALLTGAVIAGYTLWDKQAVSSVQVPPILYFFLLTIVRAVLLSVYALPRWGEAREEWRLHKWHALGIGLLSPVSYILVLYALVISPVSYVAPTREIGILLGAMMGARFLSESDVRRRMGGAVAMVAGVFALAFG